MAINTALTFLETATTAEGAYTKLVDITSYPDMGSAPNMLDTTDLSQALQKTSIMGLQESPDLTFEANYDVDTFNTINDMTGTHFFQLKLGETGEYGTFRWSGEVTVFLTGGSPDEVRKMTLVLSAETPIEFVEGI